MRTNYSDDLENLLNRLGDFLMKNEWHLVTAESCTGGLVAAMITSCTGASAWFERGMVTYSNESKTELLGVSAALIEQYGAVSQKVVEAMVYGAQKCVMGASTVALAITGIAGPTGSSAEKPVGTVWFSWIKEGNIFSECKCFPGDRNAVRYLAAYYALEGCLRYWS